jgi:hypothetical protein
VKVGKEKILSTSSIIRISDLIILIALLLL